MNLMLHKIPLHGEGDAVDKLSHWANMAALNPKGFRTASEKKDRPRLGSPNRKRKHPRTRFLTRVEKLSLEASA